MDDQCCERCQLEPDNQCPTWMKVLKFGYAKLKSLLGFAPQPHSHENI